MALRFPVGQFIATENATTAQRTTWLDTLAGFPAQLAAEVNGLSAAELQRTYRPGGWSIQQLVHHCADSHMNAFIRCKLALTEENPVIKPYDEAVWAEQEDVRSVSIEESLAILKGLHQRWVHFFHHLSNEQYGRAFFHPEHGAPFSMLLALDNYAWHCRHHLAHVRIAKG